LGTDAWYTRLSAAFFFAKWCDKDALPVHRKQSSEAGLCGSAEKLALDERREKRGWKPRVPNLRPEPTLDLVETVGYSSSQLNGALPGSVWEVSR